MTQVQPVKADKLHALKASGGSLEMKESVLMAHMLQKKRYEGSGYRFNSQLRDKDIEHYCLLDEAGRTFMKQAYHTFELTARSYYKILKVARTIADLEGSEDIKLPHLEEAAFYKTINRQIWGNYI